MRSSMSSIHLPIVMIDLAFLSVCFPISYEVILHFLLLFFLNVVKYFNIFIIGIFLLRVNGATTLLFRTYVTNCLGCKSTNTSIHFMGP